MGQTCTACSQHLQFLPIPKKPRISFHVNVQQGSNYSDSEAVRTKTEILWRERQRTENGHSEKIVHGGHRKYPQSKRQEIVANRIKTT